MRYAFIIPGLLAFAAVATAEPSEKLPANAVVKSVDVRPSSVELNGPYAYAQLLVTAKLASGDAIDATRMITMESNPWVAVSPTGLVRPTADGTGSVSFKLADKSYQLPVKVSGAKTVPPVSFVTDVQPVLSKLGCNQGTCHGGQQGKNGFKLSLRGYDPKYDHTALTDDLEGRRFNRAAPEKSVMLMKPTGAVPHVGGVLWQPGEPNYEIVKQWIADDVPLDLNATRVVSIEVAPQNPIIQTIGSKQQFAVMATYADGRKRDVSAEAFIDSSNTEVATVDKNGLVTTVRRGEATLLARYEGAYAASTVVVMGDRSGFQWEQQIVKNHIDDLVDAKLRTMKIQPSGLCSDETFVRRVYLDLTGLPPTAEDVRKFLADPKPSRQKRDRLIDTLVGSTGYVEHWTNKWADMLQVNRKFLGDAGAAALRGWIRERIADNTPYNVFCAHVLTASGSNVENPPAAYYKVLRDAEAVMENTTQLFLAVRFNCNKCHDHPFEKWTQDQYYQMAAFFTQVNRKEDPKYKGQKIGGTAVEGAKSLVELIEDAKAGEITHARTNTVTPPKFPYPHDDLAKPDAPRRVQAAQWITSPKNPYFAKSYVNRVWSYLLGVGIIEPVDDIRAGNPPTNPELLDRLTNDFVASGFDVQKLIKTICKSRTYQLSLATNKWNADDETNYSHALARRLPAEVLYDSVYAVTGSTTKLPGVAPGTRAAELLDSNIELPGGFLDLLGKPVRESACECERSSGMMLGPVLAFVSGPVVGDAVQDGQNRIAKFTLAEKDDAKVVEEIYLSVLGRKPTAAEIEKGIATVRGAAADHKLLVEEHVRRTAAYNAYAKQLDAKQSAWEAALREQKATVWQPIKAVKAVSKAGPTPAEAKSASVLNVADDGTTTVSGPLEPSDTYTLTFDLNGPGTITGLRLEVLADPSLPAKGPGRAGNGNFVLNELRVTQRPTDAEEYTRTKPVKLVNPEASFQQDGYPLANALDNNPATGWAIAPQTGVNNTAVFRIQGGLQTDEGVKLSIIMDHRFGNGHSIGKFRWSATTDKTVRLTSPVSADLAKLLDVPVGQRTPMQQADLRQRYLAQDAEYQRLKTDADKVPPTDPRVLGAQDLTWVLINTPAFLFNR